MSIERCICAAIQFPDGYIVRGHRHGDCNQTAGKMKRDPRKATQGFVTSQNRFVDRLEGRQIQEAAGIPSADAVQHGGIGYRGAGLFSEDLY